jgi:hypothetical protein
MHTSTLLGAVLAAALLSGSTPAVLAAVPAYDVHDLQPISGRDPFPGVDCGLKVGPPLDASRFRPADTAFEPAADVDPRDPDTVVAVWTQDYSKAHMAASTREGGRTWTRVAQPGLTDCTGGRHQAAFDPWVSFDRDGTVFSSAMTGAVPPAGTAPDNAVAVNRSQDGGATWSQPTEAEPRLGYNDGPSILADRLRPGRVLVAWARHDGPFGGNTTALRISESTDGARTWSPPRDVYVPPPAQFVAASELTQLAGGVLVWTYGIFDSVSQLLPREAAPPRAMEALVSADGGATWQGPVKLGEQSRRHSVRDDERDTAVEREYGPSVAALAGGGAIATWSDVLADGSGVVLVTRTADGVRWSRPQPAITSPRPAFTPMVAQSRDGRIGLLWTDLRGDRGGDEALTAEYRFASSGDGGITWTGDRAIAGAFDLRQAWQDPRSVPTPGLNLGEYMGFVGVRHGFLAVVTMSAPVAQMGRSQAFAAAILRRRAVSLRASVTRRRGSSLTLSLRATERVDGRVAPAPDVVVRSLAGPPTRAVTDLRGRARLVVRARSGRVLVEVGGRGIVKRRCADRTRIGGGS